MSLHKIVHDVLKHAPDPVTGAIGGALGGTAVGAVATGTALHGVGVTVAGVVASASTIGVGATVSAIGAFAAPIILPAIGCCAAFGASAGTFNSVKGWVKGGCKIPKW